MPLLNQPGVCDCHSHVYGPFAAYPLSPTRSFEPPEAPLTELETVWRSLGIDRAVLVQGSAYGTDHRAMLDALRRSPRSRRGVAVLSPDIADEEIAELHRAGVRGVRFNWTRHLLRPDSAPEEQRLADAEKILARVSGYGWHIEVHLDPEGLSAIDRLGIPPGMPLVIDHAARLDVSSATLNDDLHKLLLLIDRDWIWVKLSGADRLAQHCPDLRQAIAVLRQVLHAARNRCVWGLDWPHVNLNRKRTDLELAHALLEVAGDDQVLEDILIRNPARLYDFGPISSISA